MEFFGVLRCAQDDGKNARARHDGKRGWVRHDGTNGLGCESGGEGLGDEQEFAGGLTGFEVAVGVGGVGEGIDVFDAEFEGVVG